MIYEPQGYRRLLEEYKFHDIKKYIYHHNGYANT